MGGHGAEMIGFRGCKGFPREGSDRDVGDPARTYGTGERMLRASRIIWWVKPHSLSYQAITLTFRG
ncbi:hypothetical protein EV648_11426 [Kribbella sp. VKM Ac-2568]|nr:hypothetical protein EV648_11426 [Kribbella sp. VKM Ac-2568]